MNCAFIDSVLTKLKRRQSLEQNEAYWLAQALPVLPLERQVDCLSFLKQKGESMLEVIGFVTAFRHAGRLPGKIHLDDCIDMCGTGGDKLNTFNATTTAAFIAAGAGARIAKSGNSRVSSSCGSSDVLTALGVPICTTAASAVDHFKEFRLAFIGTPHFFPTFASLKEARKAVGGFTICNMVGPLLNPLGVRKRILGVPFRDKASLMAHVLQFLGEHGSIVIHGEQGEDEVTVTGDTTLYKVQRLGVKATMLSLADLDIEKHPLSSIQANSVEENAHIIQSILKGEQSPKATMAILNASLAISVSLGIPYKRVLDKARASIESGRALEILEHIQTCKPIH